jgi:histidine triad (HIT) family protein
MNDSSIECIFCNIEQGRSPAEIVYKDDMVVAFHDARPSYPIHILIVPRAHIPTFNDIDADNPILSHIGQAAQKIARQFRVAESGYRLLFNVNRGGGQVIFHLHAHLLAREASPA